jgi:DNA polymerase III alpha subunit (gram-positive type)
MPQIVRPIPHAICPQCQNPTLVMHVERLGLGYYMRTFECAECKREEMKVVKRA